MALYIHRASYLIIILCEAKTKFMPLPRYFYTARNIIAFDSKGKPFGIADIFYLDEATKLEAAEIMA